MADPPPALTRYRHAAHLWDEAVRIPGTPIRLGWDALVGLVPGLGDAVGGVLGGWGLLVGWRLGAPPAVLTRMFLHVLVDVLGGSVPILGDLFDVAWRSNSRNARILERWLEEPDQVRRSSRWLLVGFLSAVLVTAMGAVLLTGYLILWLIGYR